MKVGRGSKIFETAKIVQENREIIIGENCLIGDFAFIAPRKLVMMDGSQINPHAVLASGGDIILGKFSAVGFGTKLIPATDSTSARYMCEAAPTGTRQVIRGSITLGEGAYIGSGAVVCVTKEHPHIVIGDYAVVGALSYIDKDVPPYTIIHPQIIKYVTKQRVFK